MLSASKKAAALAAIGEAVAMPDGRTVTILGYGARDIGDPLMYVVFDEAAQAEILVDPATTSQVEPIKPRPLLTLVVNRP